MISIGLRSIPTDIQSISIVKKNIPEGILAPPPPPPPRGGGGGPENSPGSARCLLRVADLLHGGGRVAPDVRGHRRIVGHACQCLLRLTSLDTPLPPQPIPKSLASPSLLAYVAVSKYADALPLYRQEQILARIGIDLSRATLAAWMVRAGELVQPLVNLMREEILASGFVQCDETRFQVLREPGKSGPRASPTSGCSEADRTITRCSSTSTIPRARPRCPSASSRASGASSRRTATRATGLSGARPAWCTWAAGPTPDGSSWRRSRAPAGIGRRGRSASRPGARPRPRSGGIATDRKGVRPNLTVGPLSDVGGEGTKARLFCPTC